MSKMKLHTVFALYYYLQHRAPLRSSSYIMKWDFQKQSFFNVSVLLDCFILLISTLHRVDFEAIEFLFCQNSLNLTYEAAKKGFDFLLHKMWLFWLHFGFGLKAGVEVAPTKRSLYGLYAHSVENTYGENKSNPIKQFRKKD